MAKAKTPTVIEPGVRVQVAETTTTGVVISQHNRRNHDGKWTVAIDLPSMRTAYPEDQLRVIADATS